MKLTVLTENRARRRGILAEHGLSLLIETEDKKILVDTGQTHTVLHNASTLGIDLSDLDAIVLSHGHYDHTGGVPAVIRRGAEAKVYIHQKAFGDRYNAQNGQAVGPSIGIPWITEMLPNPKALVCIDDNLRLSSNIIIGAKIPMNFEKKIAGEFVKINKDSHVVEDLLEDEIFLCIQENGKLWVVTGCCHRGLINTIEAAKALFPQIPLAGVIGGLHLEKLTEEVQNKLIEKFEAYGDIRWVPLHCTGMNAVCKMVARYGKQVLLLGAGDQVEL